MRWKSNQDSIEKKYLAKSTFVVGITAFENN